MDIAAEMKLMKAFNMIVLGGFLKIHPIVNTDNIISAFTLTRTKSANFSLGLNFFTTRRSSAQSAAQNRISRRASKYYTY